MARTQAEQALQQSMEQESEDLKTELERYKELCTSLEHDLNTLERQYNQCRQRIKSLKDDNAQLRKENRGLLARLNELRNIIKR